MHPIFWIQDMVQLNVLQFSLTLKQFFFACIIDNIWFHKSKSNDLPWSSFLQQVQHILMGVFGFKFLMEGSKRSICDLNAWKIWNLKHNCW
jgi:hypothetical protein